MFTTDNPKYVLFINNWYKMDDVKHQLCSEIYFIEKWKYTTRNHGRDSILPQTKVTEPKNTTNKGFTYIVENQGRCIKNSIYANG